MQKFLVTAVWSDGWTNVEEHETYRAALQFIKEALGVAGIVTIWVNKVKEVA